MTLRELVAKIQTSGNSLEDSDGLMTIFVKPPVPANPLSEALLTPQAEDGALACPSDPSFRYFLELSVALEVLEDLGRNKGRPLSAQEAVDALVTYAANDAL